MIFFQNSSNLLQILSSQGSVSVSMSIYQTLFCFVCTHLTSGERDTDLVKRNADVHDILRRTHFNSHTGIGLPKKILDHESVEIIYFYAFLQLSPLSLCFHFLFLLIPCFLWSIITFISISYTYQKSCYVSVHRLQR